MPTTESAGAAWAGPASTAHSAVPQGFMGETVQRCAAVKMELTVIISLASVPVGLALLGPTVNRSVLPGHLAMAVSSCVNV